MGSMDTSLFFQTIAAVIAGNVVFAAWCAALYAAFKQQKNGASDTELSWWIYPLGVIAPAIGFLGFYWSL